MFTREVYKYIFFTWTWLLRRTTPSRHARRHVHSVTWKLEDVLPESNRRRSLSVAHGLVNHDWISNRSDSFSRDSYKCKIRGDSWRNSYDSTFAASKSSYRTKTQFTRRGYHDSRYHNLLSSSVWLWHTMALVRFVSSYWFPLIYHCCYVAGYDSVLNTSKSH